jgi:bifunctional non-homologous end joining protein LigD
VAKRTTVEIEGRQLEVSNLDKILYPETGFTKGQLIDYYVRIAPVLLPHLKGRPLTMKRYPNGANSQFFYEKNCPVHRPEWVKTTPVWSDGNNRWMDYCTVEDLSTLVWVQNLASIELHTSLSLGKKIEQPTYIVFDLDPGPPATIVPCCQVGLWVREIFKQLGLESFAKTSGSKGLQVYVPLNTSVSYEQTKPFAKGIARQLEAEHPDLVVSDMKKSLRTNKVFVDWSQNDQYKTTVNVYSMRAKDQPTVSTPVTWKEVEQCWKKGDPELLVFTSDQTLARVEKDGDLWEKLPKMKQKPPPVAKLEALAGTAQGSRKSKTSRPRRKKAA